MMTRGGLDKIQNDMIYIKASNMQEEKSVEEEVQVLGMSTGNWSSASGSTAVKPGH